MKLEDSWYQPVSSTIMYHNEKRGVVIFMRIICLVLAVFLCTSLIAIADEGIPNLATEQETVQSGIPNMASEDKLPINGRPQKLDNLGDKDGDEINPVERRIIIRDAIRSNAPAIGN